MGGKPAGIGALQAIGRAIGLRRYVIWGTSTTFATLYGFIRKWLGDLGVTVLPDWHPLAVTAVVFFGFLFFFLVSRLKELESGLEPRLEITGPLAYTRPKGAEGKAVRTYKVRITNLSLALVPNVHVTLEKMINRVGEASKEHGRCFRQTLDVIDESRASYRTTFDLSPHDWKEIDLVRFDETKNDTHVQMMYAVNPRIEQGVFLRVPRSSCPHEITIRASASNTVPVFRTYSFDVDSDGFFTLEHSRG